MTNPKVFEYAKEIGMTPLALMDKIKEWHLPIKSHMSEIEPEVLVEIKKKLSGSKEDSPVEKKVVRKKATPKKKEELSAEPKAQVIRRRTQKESEEAEIEAVPAAEPVPQKKAQIISRPASVVEKKEIPDIELKTKKNEIEKELVQESPVQKLSLKEESPVVGEPLKTVEEIKTPVKEASEPTTATVTAAVAAVTPTRKKEVTVGGSGISSSTEPVTQVRRNIIGRMDLSRVSPPPGSNQSGRPGGYGGQRPSPGGNTGGVNRPGGFTSQRPTTGVRNIRAGFVAVQNPEEPIFTDDHEARKSKENEKKSKRMVDTQVTALTAKEKELAESQVFNAVEFRKRELVFQPKKKKDSLDREARKTQLTTPKASKRVLKVYGTMKVSDIAMEMGIKVPQLTKALVSNGVMANMNTQLDFDTISLIVPEFDWEAQNIQRSADELLTELKSNQVVVGERVTRPPVVTVMGHVDHGKTSLLDAIRNENVAKGEAGGITQHIGAYNVKLEDGSLVTFLDTPGHEAFTAMRARGANITDIAVIVVAADDGMMPQTQEAINHAKAAGVPIIVAVNKMDKPGANPEKIKQQLTELQIVPEEWGGTTIFCPVSALKKTGIKELLESIKLTAEVQDLKANPNGFGQGIVIEAKMEKGKGAVATLLVKDGTVRVGQNIVAGAIKGKIRSLMNDRGVRVDEVGPGWPVEVQGLESVPTPGDRFDVVKDESTAEKVAMARKEHLLSLSSGPTQKLTLEEIFSKVQKGDVKELAIILKADVQGSLEAVQGMISKLSTVEVKTKVVHAAVGGITETDILLSHTSKAIVIGFNVRPDSGAQAQSKRLGVEIRTYSIVYELVDDLKKAMTGLLVPDIVEKVLGSVEVRNIFSVPKIGTIAGCFVKDGKVQRSNLVRLTRDGRIIYEGKISSLKRFKDDAKEVAQGYECGIGIENFNDVKVGDIIESYVKEEVARELTPNT
ncbi:MAG TPA: translation initiation factor IF-2 [Pseudobdellovibrionaceae bacterium]|nr:translation initiation factor IF-2 [Pseudobdellovibrionaceae bacterium]